MTFMDLNSNWETPQQRDTEREYVGLKGRVELWAYSHGELFDYQDHHNIVLGGRRKHKLSADAGDESL